MNNGKVKGIVGDFVSNGHSVRNNANLVHSLPALEEAIISDVIKEYLLDDLCSDLDVSDMHRNGWIYVHQTKKLSPYCIGLSAEDIARHGLKSNAQNERMFSPPRRLDSFFRQCSNLICLISQEVSGAVSLNDISTVAAAYLYLLEVPSATRADGRESIKYDRYTLRNIWQSFLCDINLPFRAGSNSPFSNITLNFSKPASNMKNRNIVFTGKVMEHLVYDDVPPEFFDRINMAFIEAMEQGDSNSRPFTFPLITVNIDKEFDTYNAAWKVFLDKSRFWGGFYVQNYLQGPFTKDSVYKLYNPYIRPFDQGMIYSNCCRLLINMKTVESVTGSNPFHSIGGVGGIGVFSINMNRLLWLAGDNFTLLTEMLGGMMEKGSLVLQRKRQWIKGHWSLYPYLSFYQSGDRSLYNIFSVVGVHEGMISAGFENGLFNDQAKEYAHKIGQWICKKIENLMARDNVLYSLEYAPSESAACKMAYLDTKIEEARPDINGLNMPGMIKGIIERNGDCSFMERAIHVNGVGKSSFLTAGFQAPMHESSLVNQIDVNSHFQAYATGGSIFHMFLGQEPTPEQVEELIFGVIKNFPIQYMTVTPIITICESCGKKEVGKHIACKWCRSTDVSIWSRPVGYFRPILRGNISQKFDNADNKFWQDGRIFDFSTRKEVDNANLVVAEIEDAS